MLGAERGEYRDVVVFPSTNEMQAAPEPANEDGSMGHRSRPPGEFKSRQFGIHDPEGGVTYHASHHTRGVVPGSIRHRHNFEQLRFIVSGELQYGQKRYGSGWLGYFPQGIFYGPEARTEAGDHFIMQFPGSGNYPFPPMGATPRAATKVREAGGRFENGICIWPDGRKQDAHEACTEALYGKPVEYPAPVFADQVWINTNNIPWEPTELEGVSTKRLAYFHHQGPAVQMIRLLPGASIPGGTTTALMIRYVYEGEAQYGGQACAAVSNLYYPPRAPYQELRSDRGATILSVELQAMLPGSEPPLPFCL